MLFTSFQFIVFFGVTWMVWRLFPLYRKIILLAAGLLFICSYSWTSAILCFSLSLLNYNAALVVEDRRKPLVYFSIQLLNVTLIPLGNFFTGSALFYSHENGHHLSFMFVTLGLSFYGLQHFAYMSDVWTKRIMAEREPLLFLLASTYFLKFVSGPVTLHQEIRPYLVTQADVRTHAFPALNRILIGYFKKMVIADALASSVSSVFDYGDTLPALTILAGAFLFTLQLYFDFSGYCDIAIGCSLLFGIQLPENFNFPFRASSMTVFWRRWHITLLKFFTTYVFYPVSFYFRKFGKHGSAIAVVTVFLLSAVWHGFGLTFFLWGICHSGFMLIEHYYTSSRSNGIIGRLAGVGIVLFLFSFSNIFFRSPDMEACSALLSQVFDVHNILPSEWAADFLAPLAVGGHQIDRFNFYSLLVLTLGYLAMERKIMVFLLQPVFRPVPAFVLLFLIFVFGVFSSGNRFIYMQF